MPANVNELDSDMVQQASVLHERAPKIKKKYLRFGLIDVLTVVAVPIAFILSYLVTLVVFALVLGSIFTLTGNEADTSLAAFVLASFPAFVVPWFGMYWVMKLLAKLTHQEFVTETYKYFAVIAVVALAADMWFVTKIIAPTVLTDNYTASVTLLVLAYTLARIIVVRRHKGHYTEVVMKEKVKPLKIAQNNTQGFIETPAQPEKSPRERIQPELLAKLKKYKVLQQKGILTNEEFEAKKKQLLD